ncbi:MAG: hypothetical protein NWE76_07990 [Candidatus Bathyarchaeota archaeon]|nr:hypothetical protein [Candidatus Bathyarchaeota archaeon]
MWRARGQGRVPGTHITIGYVEHSEIIRLYVSDGLGMGKLGRQIGRSSPSVKNQIDTHNRAVSRSGFCPSCRCVKGPFEGQVARKA